MPTLSLCRPTTVLAYAPAKIFGALTGTGIPPSWAKGASFICMAHQFEDRAARRLKEMASQEEAAAKERLSVRTAAARSFVRASGRLEDARAVWERAQEDVRGAKAKAVADLLGTGMEADEVAGLLGLSERELKALRAATGARGEKANRGEAVVPGTDRAAEEGQPARLAG